MKTVLFATSNERKLAEARATCKDFAIEVEPARLQIDEIQHHDTIQIAKHKAAAAFRLTKLPVVITDTSWSIPALGGFPGGYMKDVDEWFEPEDFINLLSAKADKRVSFTETIIYTDGTQQRIFSQEYWGKITDIPRGSGSSIEQVAEFDGHTIGERRDQGKFSHDPKDYLWYQFAKWFSKSSC